MKKTVLFLILRIAKVTGLFVLARKLTAKDLRILCYHGGAVGDESLFRPNLYMTRESFEARLKFLADKNYPVLALGEAIEAFETGTLPPCATAITIDDGWYGTYTCMAPALRRHGFPATLYVASYYLEKQTQVFNMAVAYLLWKGGGRILEMPHVADDLTGRFDLKNRDERDQAWSLLTDYGNKLESAADRQTLFRRLAGHLGQDWAALERERIISFMTETEARQCLDMGIDLQLHTHRHHFPDKDFAAAEKEIEDNRTVLRRITGRPLVHFCYPSGEYTSEQLPWLTRMGIKTATTTKPGFNRRGASVFELTRFLDTENITMLEFEAEMSGFFELIRRCSVRV